jgi:hypothetical protein
MAELWMMAKAAAAVLDAILELVSGQGTDGRLEGRFCLDSKNTPRKEGLDHPTTGAAFYWPGSCHSKPKYLNIIDGRARSRICKVGRGQLGHRFARLSRVSATLLSGGNGFGSGGCGSGGAVDSGGGCGVAGGVGRSSDRVDDDIAHEGAVEESFDTSVLGQVFGTF